MGYIKLTRYKHYNSFSLGGWGGLQAIVCGLCISIWGFEGGGG